MKYYLVIFMALFSLYSVQAECPVVCPLIYMPTCAFDGNCYKIFSNRCMMDVENCRDKKNFSTVSFEMCKKKDINKCENNEEESSEE